MTSPAATDQDDFLEALAEYGCDEATARRTSENTADLVDMPGAYPFAVGPSQIEGQGIIATQEIAADKFIGPARLDRRRTPLGRYTNHAKVPNAAMFKRFGGDVDLFSLKTIAEGAEITVDYRQVAAEVQRPRPRSGVKRLTDAQRAEMRARALALFAEEDALERLGANQRQPGLCPLPD